MGNLKLQIVNRKIETINIYENNPRKNEAAVDAVAESIKEFGFKQPIVIDRHGVIVAGHTRYLAAIQLGLDSVPCVVADDLTDEQIRAYRLVDNKTNELADWDYELLGQELDNIISIDLSEFGFEKINSKIREMQNYVNTGGRTLVDDFTVPPFSILDGRQGYWLKRQREWKDIIMDDGRSRGDVKIIQNNMGKSFAEASILDPVLAEVIVKWFMPEPEYGRNCFDVFSGDTAFGFVSSYLGANFKGIELRKEQVDFNNFRAKMYGLQAEYICGDGIDVLNYIKPESQDLLFSCPPYFDLEVYSDDERDASNQSTYKDFLEIINKAFSNAIKCLKNTRFAVIVAGDVRDRKSGFYYGFCDDIKRIFKSNGMALYNEIIKIDPVGTGGIRAANSMKNRKVVKTHQNVLVFYKGRQVDIKKYFGNVRTREEYAGKDI